MGWQGGQGQLANRKEQKHCLTGAVLPFWKAIAKAQPPARPHPHQPPSLPHSRRMCMLCMP